MLWWCRDERGLEEALQQAMKEFDLPLHAYIDCAAIIGDSSFCHHLPSFTFHSTCALLPVPHWEKGTCTRDEIDMCEAFSEKNTIILNQSMAITACSTARCANAVPLQLHSNVHVLS